MGRWVVGWMDDLLNYFILFLQCECTLNTLDNTTRTHTMLLIILFRKVSQCGIFCHDSGHLDLGPFRIWGFWIPDAQSPHSAQLR